jgi:hypothetical protein
MGSDILYEAIEDLEKHMLELKTVLIKLVEFGKAAQTYIDEGVEHEPDINPIAFNLYEDYQEKLDALDLKENDWEDTLKLLRSL